MGRRVNLRADFGGGLTEESGWGISFPAYASEPDQVHGSGNLARAPSAQLACRKVWGEVSLTGSGVPSPLQSL